MNLRGPHGLEIRIMPLPLLAEADYIKVRRGASLILLGEKWLLHSANRVRRLPKGQVVVKVVARLALAGYPAGLMLGCDASHTGVELPGPAMHMI